MKNSGDLNYLKYKILLIVILLLGIFLIFYFFINRDKSFNFSTENEIIYKDNYTIHVNYPLFNENTINNEIKKIVKTEKNNFLEIVNKIKNYDNELNINYSYTMNNNIYSIHMRTYSYTGKDNEYYRKDKLFYIDSKTNKQVELENLIINDEIYDVLKKIVKKYLEDNKNKLTLYSDRIVNEALNNKETYNIIFSEDKSYIIIPPHKISLYDTEISINVEYKYIKKYLNPNYFGSLDNIKEIDYMTGSVERIRDYDNFKDKKLVALTFDDGPSYKKTQKLVDELNKRDARVTFFMLGELANRQPELVKYIYTTGHTIGSHTYDHKNLKKLKDEQLEYEINHTNEILKNITGHNVLFLRPPYGAYNQSILNKVNMSFILWSYDTLDWKLRNVEKVTNEIIKGAKDGEIILLHDIHSESVEAAIKAIDILQNEGYAFVSLEEMIAYKNVKIAPNSAYRYFRNPDNDN